ncbi:MAG TPA: POTRA domain-containing protein [Polyangiaceae bacterium]|jgi:outer membrane protein assembly factor BamA|nr:POTRA domain-containing protein [Polyangiaceae bacterium]
MRSLAHAVAARSTRAPALVRALVCALVAALVLAFGPGVRLALAQSAPDGAAARPAPTVYPIPLPAPLETAAQVPVIDPPADLGPYVNRPVARVAVVLEGNVWDDVEVPPVTSLKPGDPVTATSVRAVLRELMRSGRFARGRVTVGDEGAGVVVTARVVPRKLIDRLQVDLHGARLDLDELLRSANLAESGEIVATDLETIPERLERSFAVHGYPSAKARIQMRDTDDPTRTLVLIDVAPGAPRLIGDRRFYVFGAQPESVEKIAGAYGPGVGDRADAPVLDQADANLAQALRSKGWWSASVSHDLVWVVAPGGGGHVTLRVRVDAGALSTPTFDGNEHYDADVLGAALDLENETDRSPGHLADKIRLFYEKRGFLDAEVRLEVRGVDAPVRLLVFHIEEHRRVRVTGRRYPCLKLDAIRNLSNGGPTSSSAIGTEIDSFLDDELPGADLLVDPNPRGLDATIGPGTGQVATGSRAVPLDLRPDSTYAADTYERAVEHVQELYRNEGFLHAQVGPIGIVRATCDPKSPPGRCRPLPMPADKPEICRYDPGGLPLPSEPLDPALACRSDPAHGVECAPRVELVIPVKLGPRTRLWDIAFTGVTAASEREVADAADVALGDPVSTDKLEEARRRIVDWYKERGYYYVDVKFALEPSADNTRARLRFDVTEGDQVIVRSIVLRGLDVTRESVVRRRIALVAGQPYRASDVRHTQERIATLGVVSSITVGLAEPYVPQATKDVIIDLVEKPGHYLEMSPGFSTGEGVRGTLEYDERNILGYAIGATFRTQLSYLPDFLILDSQVAANYAQVTDRLARRITLGGAYPDIGLGPLIHATTDAIYVRDLERDFTLDKISGVGTLIYRPGREFQVTVGQSVENNDIRLFQFNSVSAYIYCNPNGFDSQLASLLRVPDGESFVLAERGSVAWDRRDNAFNAHTGTYAYLGAELVNSFPEGSAVKPDAAAAGAGMCSIPASAQTKELPDAPQATAHFVRMTQTFAGYIPITKHITFAAELRLGENVKVAACDFKDLQASEAPPTSCTYPDRLFFMGGFDSMRGWLQDTFMPQEYANNIAKTPSACVSSSSNCQITLRGGNFMINPRFELRFPVRAPIDAAVFADFGNLYTDLPDVFSDFRLHADVGAGIRVDTPVGPLVFDYGVNVTRRPFEDFGAFHFAIGLF